MFLEFHQKTRYYVSSLYVAKRITAKTLFYQNNSYVFTRILRQFRLYKLITKEPFAFETDNRN